MSEQIKQAVAEEVTRVKDLTHEAAVSGAYMYPIKGIFYFISHRALWRPFLSKFGPTATLALGILVLMFLVTYVPQAAVLSIFNGPVAVLSTVLLVLSESATLFTVISKNFLIEDALVDVFDGTLLEKGCTPLVASGRELRGTGAADAVARLGRLLKRPFARFTPRALVTYVMYLPLNFIPVVGTVLFVVMQGKRAGPGFHARYFQLKGWGGGRRTDWVHEHRGAYTGFGVVAVLLELIPLASIVFAYTNTVGAALWAAELERKGGTAPKLREQAKKLSEHVTTGV